MAFKELGQKAKHIGICFDTCHAFVNSTYDIRDIKIGEFIIEKLTSLTDSLCIHINDSDSKTQDRHADIFKGLIGNDKKGGNSKAFLNFISIIAKKGIPMVTERIDNEDEVQFTQNKLLFDVLNGDDSLDKF